MNLETALINEWAKDQTARINENLKLAKESNFSEMTFEEFSDLFEDRDPEEFFF